MTLYNILSLAGDDYESLAMLITFAAGETTQIAFVPILTDNIGEGMETFTAVLSFPSDGVAIRQGAGTATVSIMDATTVVVEFEPATYTATEGGGVMTFTIVKRNQATRDVSVLFSTATVAMGAEGMLWCVI